MTKDALTIEDGRAMFNRREKAGQTGVVDVIPLLIVFPMRSSWIQTDHKIILMKHATNKRFDIGW